MRASHAFLALSLGLTACPSDDAPPADGSTGAATTGPMGSSDASTGASSSTTADASSSSSGAADSSSTGDPEPIDYEPVLLDCAPGSDHPFETQTNGFMNAAAEQVAADNPRIKDFSSDLLGNPEGPYAYTTLGNTDPASQAVAYEGRKARTASDTGLDSTPLDGEAVSLWRYDGETWTEQDRQMTDADGMYGFDDAPLSNNNRQPLYAVLEADQSCAPHYTWLLDPGSQFVLTDIDATLSLSDEEFSMQLFDIDYDPLRKTAAVELMQTWASKGYTVVYMTARPHLARPETRAWLEVHGFPAGPLITAGSLAVGGAAEEYKSAWGSRMLSDFGWEPVAAYGNAETDIGAYEAAGIPKDITFIIGELAGTEGTMPIENDDYTTHIAEFVDPYPDAG